MSLMRREESLLGGWSPFRELDYLAQRMNRAFGRLPAWPGEREALAGSDWIPSVNVSENAEEYRIQAELPGVDKKDVRVSLQDGALTIQGERKQEKEEKGAKFHRVECAHGKFVRRFGVPEDADVSKISASFKDGMLNVRIARSPQKEPRSKEIAVG